MQPGFFDDEDRLAKLKKLGDPLPRLDSIVDWAAFRPLKLIRRYAVTEASVHDSRVFDEVLDEKNSGRSVWADSAYRPEAREDQLRAQGYQSRIHRKNGRRRRLSRQEQAAVSLTYTMRRLEVLLRPQSAHCTD